MTDPSPESGVGIVGAGALGLIFAAALATAPDLDTPVVIVTRRQDAIHAINTDGIYLNAEPVRLGHIYSQAGVVAAPPDEIGADLRRPIVLVLGSGGESEYSLSVAQGLVTDDGVVVMLQNGLQGWRATCDIAAPHITGATYAGGWTVEPNQAVWASRAQTVLPDVSTVGSAQVECVRVTLDHGLLPAIVSGTEAQIVWRKLLVTAVSWVAGALAIPLSMVLRTPSAVHLLERALDEVIPIARSDGADVSIEEIRHELDLLRQHPAAKGSAYAALERGTPLEVIDNCRAIADRGAQNAVPVPTIEMLATLAGIQQEVFHDCPRALSENSALFAHSSRRDIT